MRSEYILLSKPLFHRARSLKLFRTFFSDKQPVMGGVYSKFYKCEHWSGKPSSSFEKLEKIFQFIEQLVQQE